MAQGLVWTPRQIYSERTRRSAMSGTRVSNKLVLPGHGRCYSALPSGLGLLTCLIYSHGDRQSFSAAAKPRATHRSSPKIIKADRNPDMGLGDANAICRVEADPSQILHIGLSPGMPSLLGGHTVGTVKVAPDVPRRHTESARCRDKDMGKVLTDSAPKCESLDGSGCCVRWVGVESNF